MKRRDFVKNTSLASSLLFVPSFVKAFDDMLKTRLGYKRLVIIQMAGGNDGLNTVVPYRNDIYYKNRPSLAIPRKKILRINDELGFNNNLKPLKRLYDQGYLTIINNVGYPNPDRSHFGSTDIWHTAANSNTYLETGWVGRFLDHYGKKPYNAIEIDESLSLMMKGESIKGIATNNPQILYKTAQDPFFNQIIKHNQEHLSEHNLGYLYKTMIETKSSAKYIYETTKVSKTRMNYENNEFAKQLKTTAEFINSGIDTKIFYTSISGFDTHARQENSQNRLLEIYATAIETFIMDLKRNNKFKDTLVLTFSEFGRRVEQNAANGTDHGAANNVFIMGENLQTKGVYNPLDDLRDLDGNGDIRFEIDFREIYATVLSKWLDANPRKVLNSDFKELNFI